MRVALLAILATLLSLPVAAAPAPPAARTRPKVCLVLAGGGARGISHVGVLKVLEEMRVPIDCIVGTSMGAIVGAAYAGGLDAAAIEDLVRSAEWSSILSDVPNRADHTVYDKGIERPHAVSAELGVSGTEVRLPKGLLVGHELQRFLRRLVPDGSNLDFDALPIPYRAVATNFETGGLVVLSKGDLAQSVRASMSVPGAFSPVTINGLLLADGGLVRNLPIDVAREFHPDAIIAVDLGAPLLKREELNSLLAAGLQTLNILSYQNIERSRAELTSADVLLSPDVTDVSPADFANSFRAVARGETVARAAADRLARFSVPDDEYRAWRSAHVRPPAPTYTAVRVDTTRLRHVTPAAVTARLGSGVTLQNLDSRVDELMGTGDFERVDVHGEPTPDGDVLVVRPVEKSWGPNYLHVGIALGADFSGGSDFTMYADHRETWLNDRGLEWRLHGSVGRTNSLVSELRQPLDSGRDWFVSGLLGARREQRNVYVDAAPLATYRLGELDGFAGLGRSFGTSAEFVLGAGVESAVPRYFSGISAPSFDGKPQDASEIRARFVADTLDNLDFPQAGHFVLFDTQLARPALGSQLHYDRLSATLSQALGSGGNSLLLTGRFSTSAGSPLPFYRGFSLGGFLNLSGLREDQLVAEREVFLRAVFRHRLLSGGDLLPGLFVGASLEGADARDLINPLGTDVNGHLMPANLKVGAASLFLSAQSVLGPGYLALGHSRAGQTAVYLYFGRP